MQEKEKPREYYIKTIKKNLQFVRKKIANISQKKLGKEFDITQQTVANWENLKNKTIPDPIVIYKICSRININLYDFYSKDLEKIILDEA